MNEILVATDGTQNARHALDEAVELAAAAGARLTIVYVRHAPMPVLGEPIYQRALSADLRFADETVAIAAGVAHSAGVEVETEVLEGDPAKGIVELAQVRDTDLIVVGSRGLGALAGTLLGSVSRDVLRHADRPVLVVARRDARSRAA